jgi:hypothetical protein
MEGEEGSKTESPKHGRRSTTIKGLKRNSMVNTNEERRNVLGLNRSRTPFSMCFVGMKNII